MVAATTSNSALGTRDSALPLLPAPDEAILTRLFKTDAPSLKDLFESLTQSPIDGSPKTLLDLCRWSQRDDIRPWLDFHASELSAAIRRRRILKLEQIADTTKDLVEQRRACTTALRALTEPSPRRASLRDAAGAAPRIRDASFPVSRGVPATVPQTRDIPSEPRPSGSGRCQPPVAPNHAPFHAGPQGHQSIGRGTAPASAPTNHTTPQGSQHPSSIHPQTYAYLAHPPESLPSPHPPTSQSPDPPPSLESLLELTVSHIQTPRDPISIAALAGALAPNATINNIPFDSLNPEAALATLPTPTSNLIDIDPPTTESTDNTISWSTLFTYAAPEGNPDRTRFRLTLARTLTSPHPDRWLIASLDHRMISDSS